MKQKLHGVSHGILSQAKRFSRFLFAAVLASSMLPAFAQSPRFVVTVNSSPYTYDGNAKEPLQADLTVEYDADDGSDLVSVATTEYSIDSYSNQTNAGTASVNVKGNSGSPNSYANTVTGTGTYTIDKAAPAAAHLATYTFPTGFLYDGTDNSLSFSVSFAIGLSDPNGSGNPSVEYVDASGVVLAGAPTEAGSYSINAVFDGSGDNFNAGRVPLTGTYTIAKADPVENDLDYTIPGSADIYSGAAQGIGAVTLDATLGKSGLGDVTVKYTSGGTTITNPTNVGTYTVTVEIAEGNNFNATSADITLMDGSNPATYEIGAKSIAGVIITVDPTADLTYSGSAKTPSLTVTDGALPDLIDGTDYVVSSTGGYSPDNINAGTVTVQIAGIGNYDSGTNKTETFEITKKEISINPASTISVGSKTFDGTDDVTGAISGVDFLNLVTGQSLTQGSSDDYEITSPRYDNINAGVNKSVSGTVTLKAAGTVAKNYTFAGGLTAPLPSGVKGEITKDGGTQVAFASAPTLPANSVGTYTFDLNTLTPTNSDPAGTLIFSNAHFVDGTSTDNVTGNDATTEVGTDGHTLTYVTTGGSTNTGNTAMVTVDVESQNYASSTVNLVISLTGDVIETLSFPEQTKEFTYGAPIFSNPATRGGVVDAQSLPVTYASSNTSVADVDTDGKVTIVGAGGPATITATIVPFSGLPNRTGATASYAITVLPAPLMVTALPQTISSTGNIDAVPSTSTVSYSGFVPEEDESTVTITTPGALARSTSGTTAGTYTNEIIFSTVPVITNYVVTQATTGGTLTIAEAPNLSNVTATGGNSLIRVSYSVNPNGSPIDEVEVKVTPDNGDPFTTYSRSGNPVEVPAANGKSYTVEVRVKNGVDWNTEGWVSAPNPARPTAPSTPAPQPSISNVGATAGDAQATVTFAVNAAGKAVTNYTVVSTPGNITASGTTNAITVPGLTNGTAYTFKVTVNFADGSSITSTASPAVTPKASTTGIDDVEEVPTVKLYPNPATDIVTIAGLQGNETIRFYDANGRAVLTRQAKASEEVITVSQLQKGIYIVHIGTKALKLVKK